MAAEDDAVKVDVGEFVTYYSPVSNHTALVTRSNPDRTVSLTIFGIGEIYYRDNVQRVDGTEESDEEKYGFWEERWDTMGSVIRNG